MNRLSDTIKEKYIIRHTKKQKSDFREFICGELEKDGIPVQVISGKSMGIPVHNIVSGNPDTAEYIITAHYDTPNTSLCPIIMFGDSFIISMLGQLIPIIPLLALAYPAGYFFGPTGALIALYAGIILCMLTFTNKNNFNDNTSGVLTVLEIMYSLTEEERKKCAFVLFDNEEKGLLGSSFMAGRMKNKKTPVLNFDCVGNGDEIIIFYKKSTKAVAEEIAAEGMMNNYSSADKNISACRRSLNNILYMSDDNSFPGGICFAAFCTSFAGKYLSRIHTNRDTVCDDENITLLCRAVSSFIKKQQGN